LTQDAAAPATSRTETELIAAILRRDRKASAEFVVAHADAVYGYVARRLLPREDIVEDVVQEVFLDAWRSLAAFRGDSPLRVWLLGIARHKVQDYFRARLREADFSEGDTEAAVAEESGFDELLDQQRTADRVERILSELPESYRLALLWRYWEKRSVQEMAEETGKTGKAIERLLARARERFKRRWSGE
jgi:RNA polymerase sigma-70 factor (ECF subfamily)